MDDALPEMETSAKAYEQAMALHDENRLDEAERLCQRALLQGRGMRDAALTLASYPVDARRLQEAIARIPTLRRSLRWRPPWRRRTETHSCTRGQQHTQAGRLYVSKLSLGTHIEPPRGPTNQRLRCHLGVKTPDGDCGLKVGGETPRWEEGCIVFDDSLEHEAWNHTSEPRIVLIIDFWHPDLALGGEAQS